MKVPIKGIRVALDKAALHVVSERAMTVLSSAVVGADLCATRHILNMHVPKGYRCERPEDDLIALANRLGITEPFVGMMTAAALERTCCAFEQLDELAAAVWLTLGLTNPMAAGVSAPTILEVGTINIIALVDANLTASALGNAVVTATEAKTLALIEGGAHTREGGYATGTSTDSVVIACTGRGEPLRYAGTATGLGWLLGRAVRRGVREAMALIQE